MRQVIMPSIGSFMSHMSSKFAIAKNIMKTELSKRCEVCLTTDIWTHRSRSFIGVSCHFIDLEWKRKSYILAFRRMEKRHTYDNLAESLSSILKEFDLDCQKVRHIVTDGGSNFCKAFRVFGRKHFDEFSTQWANNAASNEGEELQIIIQNEEEAADSIEYINVERAENTFDVENAAIELEQLDLEEVNLVTRFQLPPQMRCFAHLLNLIGKKRAEITFVKNSKTLFFPKSGKVDFIGELEKHKKAYDCFTTSYNKLKRFWNLFIRSAEVNRTTKEGCRCSFVTPTATRWNSEYDAMKDAYNKRDKVCFLSLNDSSISKLFIVIGSTY